MTPQLPFAEKSAAACGQPIPSKPVRLGMRGPTISAPGEADPVDGESPRSRLNGHHRTARIYLYPRLTRAFGICPAKLTPSLPWPNRTKFPTCAAPAKPERTTGCNSGGNNQKTDASGVYDVKSRGRTGRTIACFRWPVHRNHQAINFEGGNDPMKDLTPPPDHPSTRSSFASQR